MSFGNVPVKHLSTKQLYIHNTGEIASHFKVYTSAPFEIEPKEATLMPGDGVQFVITFLPEKNIAYNEDLIIEYDNGECVKSLLTGVAEDVMVKLSSSLVDLPETFISQTSQRQIKIVNKSNIKVYHAILFY